MLEVVYLIFNESYPATAGDDWMRPALREEALCLGRVLAELYAAQHLAAPSPLVICLLTARRIGTTGDS